MMRQACAACVTLLTLPSPWPVCLPVSVSHIQMMETPPNLQMITSRYRDDRKCDRAFIRSRTEVNV